MTKETKETIKEICRDLKREVSNDYDLAIFLKRELNFTIDRLKEDLNI